MKSNNIFIYFFILLMTVGSSSCTEDELAMNSSSYEYNITINGVESKVNGSATNSEAGNLYLYSAGGTNNYPVGTFNTVKLHLNSINSPDFIIGNKAYIQILDDNQNFDIGSNSCTLLLASSNFLSPYSWLSNYGISDAADIKVIATDINALTSKIDVEITDLGSSVNATTNSSGSFDVADLGTSLKGHCVEQTVYYTLDFQDWKEFKIKFDFVVHRWG